MNPGQLAGDGGEQQQAGGEEDCHPADVPLRFQPCAQEKHRHDRQEDVVAKQVHLRPVEPGLVQNGSGQKGTDHEMKTRPVAGEAAGCQPDQADIPTVRLRQTLHQGPDRHGRDDEADDKCRLATDALPIQQDERQDAPDGDVIEAGVTKNALTQGLTQDLQFLHEQHQDRKGCHRTGHADAEDDLPILTLCSGPAGKLHQTDGRHGAEHQRRRQGEAGRDSGLDPVGPELTGVQL